MSKRKILIPLKEAFGLIMKSGPSNPLQKCDRRLPLRLQNSDTTFKSPLNSTTRAHGQEHSYSVRTNMGSMQIRHFTNPSAGRTQQLRLGRFAVVIMAGGVASGVVYQVLKPNFAGWMTAKAEAAKARVRVMPINYRTIYDEIERTLDDPGYDDSSYGPVYVRLAWHASGSYDKETNTGGSGKATMRFAPEATYSANRGLENARDRLEIVKQNFPEISYGDLWTLAAVCAIQEMGGPIIPWRPGRKDGTAADCPPDGRLPDGSKRTPAHPREIFYRMGFNDQELVCLIGCHSLGRCHKERSDFQGPWTFSPTSFSNQFFVQLLDNDWKPKKDWDGNQQFEDPTGELMMLPTDLTLKSDPEFRKWVEIYAKDEKRFFCDFALAFVKLIELGVEFPEGTKTHKFKRKLT